MRVNKKIPLISLVLIIAMMFSNVVFANETVQNDESEEESFTTYNLETGESFEWEAEDSNCDFIPPQAPAHDAYSIMPFYYQEPWTQVSDTTRFPYSSIVHLDIYYTTNANEKATNGTGFVVGTGKILTAAHCLQSVSGKIPKRIVAYVSPNGSRDSAVYSVQSSSYTVNTQWKNGNRNVNYDYGLLRVNGNINLYTGVMGVRTTVSNSTVYELAGYPQNPNEPSTYNGFKMYMDAGQVNSIYANSFSHGMNTFGGISGAPIFDNNVAVGIQTWGNDAGMVVGGDATRITTTVINLINS